MQVARWGNSLAVRIPAAVVEALELTEGVDIEMTITGKRSIEISRDPSMDQIMDRIRALSRPLPPGWKFDREEANAR